VSTKMAMTEHLKLKRRELLFEHENDTSGGHITDDVMTVRGVQCVEGSGTRVTLVQAAAAWRLKLVPNEGLRMSESGNCNL